MLAQNANIWKWIECNVQWFHSKSIRYIRGGDIEQQSKFMITWIKFNPEHVLRYVYSIQYLDFIDNRIWIEFIHFAQCQEIFAKIHVFFLSINVKYADDWINIMLISRSISQFHLLLFGFIQEMKGFLFDLVLKLKNISFQICLKCLRNDYIPHFIKHKILNGML